MIQIRDEYSWKMRNLPTFKIIDFIVLYLILRDWMVSLQKIYSIGYHKFFHHPRHDLGINYSWSSNLQTWVKEKTFDLDELINLPLWFYYFIVTLIVLGKDLKLIKMKPYRLTINNRLNMLIYLHMWLDKAECSFVFNSFSSLLVLRVEFIQQ